jgi:alpha-amylase
MRCKREKSTSPIHSPQKSLFLTMQLNVFCVLLIIAIAAVNGQVYLQGFDWPSLSNKAALYKTLAGQAGNVHSLNISRVWLPPVSSSVDTQGYMPTEWYTLVAGSNLKAAISAFKSKGIELIADVVVNHRSGTKTANCSTSSYIIFTNPPMGTDAVVSDDYECNSAVLSCPNNGRCQCGAPDTGDNFCPGPDLDHTNPSVQSAVQNYLKFLKNLGFSGWRFDLVKGYNGKYVAQYVKNSNPTFAVGEYFDSDVDKVKTWLSQSQQMSTAFDFPFRTDLKNAIASDSYGALNYGAAGVIGYKRTLASTFLDNHDTARNDRFSNERGLIMGYCVILTHPGHPFIFWEDYLDSNIQNAVREMLEARTAAGITSSSTFYVEAAYQGVYAAQITGSRGTLAAKIGTGSWQPSGTGWNLFTSGDSYAIWLK